MRISKEQYNEVLSRLETLEKTVNKGGGNPYHDELGRFTEGPSKAFGEYKADNDLVYGPSADYTGHPKDKNNAYRPFDGKVGLADNDIVSTMTKDQVDATMQTMGALRKMKDAVKGISGENWANTPKGIAESAVSTLMGYTYTVGYRSSHGKNPEPGEWSGAAWRTHRLDEAEADTRALQKVAKANKAYASIAKAATAALNTMKYIEKNTDAKGKEHLYSVSKKTGVTEREIPKNSLSSKVDNLIAKIDRITNGGKGSGNFGHSGRPGEVGGSGTGKGGHSKGAEKSESRSWYDDGNFGTAPMVIDEKDGKYKVKSFGDEQATRGLLGSDATLSEVAGLAYDKSLKGEKATEKQKQVFQQITAIRQLLKQKVGEMGDAMSFKDKKFDFDDFDTTMSHVDEYLSKARLGTVGDKSKVGEALSKSLTRLSNVTGILKMIADPDMLKKHDEAQWYDIDEQIKRRKNSLGNKADNLIAKMDKIINGGHGSGNFGHSGRPGKVGGSGPKGLSGNLGERSSEKKIESYQEKALSNLGFSDVDKMTEGDWEKVRDEMARLIAERKAQQDYEESNDRQKDKAKSSDTKSNFSMDSPEVKTIEDMGWSVSEWGDDVVISKYSDAGEDFFFYVSKDDFPKGISDYAETFDADEHAQVWIDNPGHGQPDEDILREDAANIKDELQQLAVEVELAHKEKKKGKNL